MKKSICTACIAIILSSPVFAEGPAGEVSSTKVKEDTSLKEMAQKSANPMSDIWAILMQNDLTYINGDGVPGSGRWMNSFKFQPVVTFPIMDDEWNLIFRPVVPILSSPFNKQIIDDPSAPIFNRTNGLGDMALLSMVGPNRDDGTIWGIGLTQIFPTASEDILGQHKWQAGPVAVAARLGKESGGLGLDNWNIGVLAQQWWSYAGDGNYADTSQMDLQYFMNWRVNDTALIGMAPNITIDWKAESGSRLALPIGLGYIDMIKIGKLPVRVAIEAQYYLVQRDSNGPEWNIRMVIAPIILNPFKH